VKSRDDIEVWLFSVHTIVCFVVQYSKCLRLHNIQR